MSFPVPDIATLPFTQRRWTPLLLSLLALALIAWVYWPVHLGDYVCDDIINFVQNDWLTTGDKWKHYVLRDFNRWTNYFRPLPVALFTVQVRLFQLQPGPMHVVNLALHLFDALLIGLLARASSRAAGHSPRVQNLWLVGSLLLYGLHPVLLEVVAWIDCQYDLLATLFMLLGLLANSILQKTAWRAFSVAACFFLAACSKESAATYPLMLLAFDWALQSRCDKCAPIAEFSQKFFRRNAPVLLAMLVSGFVYLAFRRYGLGTLIHVTPMHGGDFGLFGNAQRAAYTWLQYARMLLWPTHALNPMHDIDVGQFKQASLLLTTTLSVALAVLVASLYAALCHRSTLACTVLAISAAILPVANLVPTGWGVSLYQERYVINALAMVCAMLPLLRFPAIRSRIPLLPLLGLVTLVWFTVSILTIRNCLPLWRTDLNVWQWAYSQNKGNHLSQFNLIVALNERKMVDRAEAVFDEIVANKYDCADCAIILANAELKANRLDKAEQHLEYARNSYEIAKQPAFLSSYMQLQGRLAMKRGEFKDAAELLETSIQLDPNAMDSYIDLAVSLSNLGQHQRAVQMADMALALAAPNKRNSVSAWREHIAQGTPLPEIRTDAAP